MQGSVSQGQNVPFVCPVYYFPMLWLVVLGEEETLQVLTCSLLDVWLSDTKSGQIHSFVISVVSDFNILNW